MKTVNTPEDFSMIILTISKEQIKKFDHTDVLNYLQKIKSDALKYEGKLNIMVTGYDNDKRELYEIDEVKNYFQFLDKCFPYWFFFFTKKFPKNHSPFSMLISLLVPYKTEIDRTSETITVEIDTPALTEFFNIHFGFLNELTDELGMPIEENMRITKEVMENISLIGIE